jgi:hypothetical protein
MAIDFVKLALHYTIGLCFYLGNFFSFAFSSSLRVFFLQLRVFFLQLRVFFLQRRAFFLQRRVLFFASRFFLSSAPVFLSSVLKLPISLTISFQLDYILRHCH